MTVHEYEAPVDVPAEDLFEYAAEPANLPEFLSVVSEAHRTGGDRVEVRADVHGHHVDGEGWFRADAASRTLRWGVPGQDDYRGELVVHEVGGDRSRVAVRLNTARGDKGEVRRELAEAVAALAQGAAARTDAGRADRQEGWAG
ncbi:SRPBCC family protein [Actinokineospora fastidiosa]|nr:SRPBCC family protein [Actinokineospora fastidiosa]